MQAVQDMVANIVAAEQLELVAMDRAPGGLLCVTVDTLDASSFVQIEQCERITRQLQALFLVENIDYARLEVGSPGTDRPLKKPADFARFEGEGCLIKLREAFNNRKQYRGEILPNTVDAQGQTQLHLVLREQPKRGVPSKQAVPKKAAAVAEPQVLSFYFHELEWAKLDPILNFKGR